jgi:hypothetical protein
MIIKLTLEQFKSIDQDYQSSEKYHQNEIVKVVDPDIEFYGAEGKYKGIKDRTIPQDFYEIEITSYLWKVMTFAEASEKYDVAVSTLRHRASDGRFEESNIRKFGKTWLVTKTAMDRIYGIKNSRN